MKKNFWGNIFDKRSNKVEETLYERSARDEIIMDLLNVIFNLENEIVDFKEEVTFSTIIDKYIYGEKDQELIRKIIEI